MVPPRTSDAEESNYRNLEGHVNNGPRGGEGARGGGAGGKGTSCYGHTHAPIVGGRSGERVCGCGCVGACGGGGRGFGGCVPGEGWREGEAG